MPIRPLAPIVIILSLLSFACVDSDAGDTASAESDGTSTGGTTAEPTTAEPTTAEPTTAEPTTGIDLEALYDCEEKQFMEARPLSGPGFDPAQGGLIGPLQERYILHATQLYNRPEAIEDFIASVQEVSAQLLASEGLLGFALASDAGCGVSRTMGIWASEEAMYKFVGSGAHLDAMARTGEYSVSERVVHWEATAEEVNAMTWDTSRAKLAEVKPRGE